MNILGLDVAQIADLTTQVAQSGTIRALEAVADDTFEYVVSIVTLIYEQNPG